VMVLTLVGSQVNIPLYRVPVARVAPPQTVTMFGRDYVVPATADPGATVVAINVGGALIPILVSIYLILQTGMIVRMAIATAIVVSIGGAGTFDGVFLTGIIAGLIA